jgi:hypothetical protein
LLEQASMWKSLSLVAVVAATACTQAPTTDPVLVVNANDASTWFESEPIAVTVEWPADVECTNDGWNCTSGPLPAFSITSTTCNGCALSDLPLGTMENAAGFTLLPTTTDAITLSVTVESDGLVRELTATAAGDRETGLRVDCEVLRTDLLDESVIDSSELAPCGATHAADETVILAPSITTMHGASRFPFCPDGALCSPAYPRKTSQIAFTGASVAWNVRDFVTLTDATAAHQVTVTAPLADGTMSTVKVTTPALAH